MYNNFTTEQLFTKGDTNVFCNNLYEHLLVKFAAKSFNTVFCITGTVAKIIQGDYVGEIVVIPFITSDLDIFNYCAKELGKDLSVKTVAFKDRVQLYFGDEFYEIWFTNAIGLIDNIAGFYVQDTVAIPLNIL